MVKAIWQRVRVGLLALACVGLVGTTTLLGQGTLSTIRGVVTDPTGAVIPEAAVTVTNQATGVNYNLKTNSAGVYYITSLIPGTYTVQAAARGFRTYVNRNLTLTTNETRGIDVQLEVGAEAQTITVEAAAPLVNTEEGRLSALVSASQIQNMPLNGRNIYQLMQLIPGAVNSTGVNLENASTGGIATNVNGTRLNFNGFFLDGLSNKGLTGGSNAQPSPDFVQEFRITTNNYSAQYGNAAGSITDVTIRSGTNNVRGDVWEYLRHDRLNARNFFDGDKKAHWRQNQFGANAGGPIRKDKLFFFAGYEGQRFRTESPAQYTTETPEWRQAVINSLPNSISALLYGKFPGPNPTKGFLTVDDVIATNGSDFYLNPCFISQGLGVGSPAYTGGPNWGNPQTVANNLARVIGVTAAENAAIQADITANCPGLGFTAPAIQAGAISRLTPMLGLVDAKFGTRTQGVFYNGDQFIGRVDYQGEKNRIFGRFFHSLQKDPNRTTLGSQIRGFTVPFSAYFPTAAFGFVRNFSPSVVNEFRAGYTRNQATYIPDPSHFGVPQILYDTGEVGFGSYNGYPQFFHENVYNYSDMVGIVKGKHSLKLGVEYKRNIENSEFNVGRPSYYFFDVLYFAADLAYWEAAGVNPELTTGGSSHIDTNIRGWRNREWGFYVQDDWKIGKNLTLNLGLRWDYYAPHTEKYGKVTNFVFGPGANANERLANINCASSVGGNCAYPPGDTNTPNGGFIAAKELFKGDKNNLSPRFGFAWDPRGNGKMSIRGGFAVFYNSTVFNPLSNSRWNLPFYSFNFNCPICGIPGLPTYGPTNPDGTPNTTAAPTFSGAPDNPGQGPAGLGFAGNIMGWFPGNPNLAFLTGIPDPSMRTPYVENAFFGIQRELSPSMVLEVNWVGTFGKKLFWAENPNRVVNGRARGPILDPCSGQTVSSTPLVNPCFGTLRTWKNSVNSSYNALQVSVIRKMSRGLAFTSAYTWSHTLDFRSSWHGLTGGGSATEVNPFGSSGYSMDPNNISLERGNSLFDLRHRWVTSLVWELPWLKSQQGVAGKIFGGWQTNYSLSLQTGLPFTVGARRDYNLDGIRNDRPDTPAFGNSFAFENRDLLLGSGSSGDTSKFQEMKSQFPTPAPGTNGNLGRNTFSGPGIAQLDFSVFKKVPITERISVQFRGEFFNLTNRVNLYQAVANLASRNFGLSQQAFDPRVIQLGLRLSF